MTAGAEVISNGVVRKVEIEEKCVANGGLVTRDLDKVGDVATVDGNVGGVGNGYVGGDVKDDTDDSSYVFVSDSIEVSAGDPDDTGGVNVGDFGPRSDSGDEVDRLKKEEFGIEKKVIPDSDSDSDSARDVNGHLDKISGEEDAIESSPVVVTESDSIIHPSDVTVTESLSMHVVVNTTDSNTDCEVMVNGGPESTSNVIDNAECDVTVDRSGKPSEDLECQVTDDGSKLSASPIEEQEGQVTVDESGKPSEDLESNVTSDESESCVTPTEVRESQVTANASESCVSSTEEQEGQVTVDESGKPSEDLESNVTADASESCVSPTEVRESQVTANGSESCVSSTEEQEGQLTVDESGKLSEDSEVHVTANESEPCASATEGREGQVTANGSESCVSPAEEQEGQVTVDESGKPSEDSEVHVTANESESCVSPTEVREDQVTANGSELCVSSTEEQEGQVTVDESGKPSEGSEVHVTADELESCVSPTEVREGQVTANESESCVSSTEEREGQVTVDVSGKSSKDLECHVTADESVSCVSPTKVLEGQVTANGSCVSSTEEREGQVTVDESGIASEDLASHVTSNGPESFGSPIKAQECEVSVDGSDSIGSLVDNQEFLASDESEEPSGNHTEEVDGKSEEHQELLVLTSEVNVEAEPTYVCDEIKAEPLCVSEDEKAEGTDTGLTTEPEENRGSELVLTKDTDALANGQVEIFDGILETGETQISGPKVDTSVLLMLNAKKEESETLLKAESVEIEANSEDTKEHVKTEDEIQESQIVVTDKVEDDLNLEDNTTESYIEPISHVNTASKYEVSNSIDEPQEGFQPDVSSEKVEIVDLVISECNNSELLVVKSSESLFTRDELTIVEQKAEIVSDDDEKETEDIDCETEVENVNVSDEQEKEIEVKDTPVDSVPHLVTDYTSAEVMECETRVEHIGEEKETEVKDVPTGGRNSTLSFSDTIVNSGAVIEFGSIGRRETTHNIQNVETEDNDVIRSDEIPTSSVEDSVTDANDAIDVQNEEDEVLQYNFLIKIPRFEDENYRDQLRSAQLVVEEKTRLRDAIRAEMHEKRAKLKAHNEAYNAAKTEETAARRLVRLKRQEIDSVQVVINRLKNAMSVEDIDGRISNMEHMIQHETLLLKDEKQFIREIKQLKTLRDQLASNMGSPEEVKQAIDQKDHNEERMKTLRKELDSLKDKASKAEAAVKTVGKIYNEESREERELQARFRAADDVRQNAYAQLNSLKRLSYDKNKNFRQFKEDLTAARDFASQGNKDALYRLCANQVETFMEQWNNNDEFRNEYISRCNMNASRRQRAFEGIPLVPDDVAPVPPGDVNEKTDNNPVFSLVEEVKIVSSTEKHTNNNSNRNSNNVSGQKSQALKTKSVAKPTSLGSDDVAVVAELAVDDNTPTNEEIELAKRAEELRKEEIAAKLKEQRRLEEKSKAAEALERKKRNAEKAQIRAEIRARKEAEQKEKEREKRLRKKEKKKTDGVVGEEPMASLESASEAATVTKETETVSETVSKGNNNKRKAQPPPHFYSKQLKPKPIPPPLVNRNRKRWQQWGKWALAVAAVLVLFVLGNTSYIRIKFNGLI